MPEYHMGTAAVVKIASVPAGSTTVPTTLTRLCLMESVKIGSEEGSNIEVKTFCTNGQTRKISVGDQGIVEFTNMLFVDGDASLEILRDSRNRVTGKEEVFMRVSPLGETTGMPTRDVRFAVTRYAEEISVSDVIKLDLAATAINVPTFGTQP